MSKKKRSIDAVVRDALRKLHPQEAKALYTHIKRGLLEEHIYGDEFGFYVKRKGQERKLYSFRRKLPIEGLAQRFEKNPDKVSFLRIRDSKGVLFEIFAYLTRNPSHFYALIGDKPVFEGEKYDWRKLFRGVTKLRHAIDPIKQKKRKRRRLKSVNPNAYAYRSNGGFSKCPHCGAIVRRVYLYCWNCGRRLSGGPYG